MKPELVSDARMKLLYNEANEPRLEREELPLSRYDWLCGFRAALEELGIVMVQDCTVSLEQCPLREGDKCACKLVEGAVLVRAKEA